MIDTLARRALVFEHMQDGVIITDLDGRIVDWNPAAEHIFGYTRAEMLGRTVARLYRVEAPGQLEQTIIQAMETDGRWFGELCFARKDGREGRCETTVAPLRDANGKRIATVGVNRDVTERLQAEEAAHRHRDEMAHVLRVRTVGEMAAGLGHEINQPLGAIANYAEGCVRRLRASDGDPQVIAVVEEIATQALRAGRVVHRLGEFVRKQSPRCETVDLEVLVRTAVGLIEREARADGVALELTLGTPLLVRVDPVQIEQVVLNLLLNGIEAMRNGVRPSKALAISTRKVGSDFAQVEVADNGPGLAPEHAAHIFEPFFTTKPNGLGMGLAISRSIAEAHGGTLHAEGSRSGGATFVLRLPLAAGDASTD